MNYIDMHCDTLAKAAAQQKKTAGDSVTAKFAVTLPSPTSVTSLIIHIQAITSDNVTDDSKL